MDGDKKKYVLLSPVEWCEDNEGNLAETPACAVVDEQPRVVYSNLWDEYVAEIDGSRHLSLCTDTEFRIAYKPLLQDDDDYFPLPQLSAPDNPVRKEQGIYEVDEETAELLEGIYSEGKETLTGIEDEIKLLLEKHLKVALMTNKSVAGLVKAKGRKLTDEELMASIDERFF